MNKYFLTLLFYSITLLVFSQKEVYFSNLKPDSIKVKSFKGLEIQLNAEPLSLLQNFSSNVQRYNFPLYFGYFSENKIAPNWTLTYRGGIQNNIGCYQDYRYHFDSINGYNMNQIEDYKMVYYNRLAVSVGVEPRWHFGFKDRAEVGKGSFNSGWFVSIPFQISMPLPINLHTTTVNVIPAAGIWGKDYFSLYGSLSPTVGFRKTISTNWFLEGSAGLNLSTYYFSYSYYSQNVSYLQRLLLTPEIKIKAAYIFK